MFIQNRGTKFVITILAAFVLTWVVGYQPASAEEFGAITGKVVHKLDGGAVAYAIVQIDGTTIGAQADPNGEFAMHNVPPGTYTLTTQLTGWCTNKAPVVVRSNATAQVKIQLRDDRVDLVRHIRLRPIANIIGFWPVEDNLPDSGNVGSIGGLCFGQYNQQPLTGLTVEIGSQKYCANTDSLGRYVIEAVPAGIYTVTVYENGAVWMKVEKVQILAQNRTVVDFSLRYEEDSNDVCD